MRSCQRDCQVVCSKSLRIQNALHCLSVRAFWISVIISGALLILLRGLPTLKPRKFGNKLSWMVPVAVARVSRLQCLLIGPVVKVGWSFMLLRVVIGHMEGFSTKIHRLDCGIPLCRLNIF
uniref:Uncharacterized protein n=1 Tax=Opuntia streptacantha TaxID=393608 RepID=A0A7C9AV64_OPUST